MEITGLRSCAPAIQGPRGNITPDSPAANDPVAMFGAPNLSPSRFRVNDLGGKNHIRQFYSLTIPLTCGELWRGWRETDFSPGPSDLKHQK